MLSPQPPLSNTCIARCPPAGRSANSKTRSPGRHFHNTKTKKRIRAFNSFRFHQSPVPRHCVSCCPRTSLLLPAFCQPLQVRVALPKPASCKLRTTCKPAVSRLLPPFLYSIASSHSFIMMSHVKKTGSTSRYPPLGGSRSPSPTLGPNHVTPYDPPEPPNFNRSLPTPRMALFDGNNPFMNRGQLPTTIRPSSTMYSARQSFGAARSTFVGPSSPANEGNDGDGNGNASSSRAIGMARPVHPDRNLKSLPNAVEVAIESYGPHINLDSALCRKVLDGPALRIPIQRRKDRHLNTARRSNGEALLAYITGTAAPRPCKSCSKGYGPWKECIIFEGQLYGSCANCWFNASGARCTFHGKHATTHFLQTCPPTNTVQTVAPTDLRVITSMILSF